MRYVFVWPCKQCIFWNLRRNPRFFGVFHKVVLAERLPTQTQLLVNYPNPFNPETWIPFELSQDSQVSITIYDVEGQIVRQLELGQMVAGRYIRADLVAWDGKTETGEAAASGTYFYQLDAGDYLETKKMVILKWWIKSTAQIKVLI